MKLWSTILILFCAVATHAQCVTLCWDPSTSPDVVDYRIYFGTNSHHYCGATNAGLNLQHTIVLPNSGRWFFAATAVDANGNESDFSNEVEKDAKPEPPVLHGETWVRLSPVIEASTNQVDWQSFTGEPTWIAATNAMEFFITRRLVIERVNRIEEP